ncbi:SMC-Scp complex subunit ScpB [Patescibacteria group bacterium]|nr:SMC-Scp complex subunit ScpB [Patescibacteria group bacterium]
MPKEPLENQIEAVLFFKGGAVSIKELSASIGIPESEIETYAESLRMSLEGRGVRLVRDGNMLALATSPSSHELIEKMRREELEGPLGKAGLETLAVIIYRGPLSRADIEYVRGVNCTSILRSLLIRGLIERVEHPKDKRSFLYQTTAELPAFFGVSQLSELPQFAETRAQIEAIFAERDALAKKEEAGEAESIPT